MGMNFMKHYKQNVKQCFECVLWHLLLKYNKDSIIYLKRVALLLNQYNIITPSGFLSVVVRGSRLLQGLTAKYTKRMFKMNSRRAIITKK